MEITLEQLEGMDFDALTDEERSEVKAYLEGEMEQEVSQDRVSFWVQYPWQKECNEMFHQKVTVVAPLPNKLGKTITMTCISYSWLVGYEPWHEVDPAYPGAVKIKRGGVFKYFRPSSLGIAPPVSTVIVGTDWGQVGEILVPMLKEWAPVGSMVCTRKNEQGVEDKWLHKNGSKLKYMTKTQDDMKFESSKIHGFMEDEPPDRKKREGLRRGFFYDSGKEGIFATPIDEPWMLDELILKNDPEVAVLQGYTILDNPDKYAEEVRALKKMGLDEKQMKEYFDLLIYDDPVKKTCVKDKGARAEQFVRSIAPADLVHHVIDLSILRFVKDIHPNKAPARLHGTYWELVGRAIKKYEHSKHVIPAREVRPDWLVIPCIDWHPVTEIALSFIAMPSPEMWFVIEEIYRNMSWKDTADIIINRKIKDKWRMRKVFIDAISKGDDVYDKNQEKIEGRKTDSTFNRIEKRLKVHRLKLVTGPRKPEQTVEMLNDCLEGPNGVPTVFFFDTIASNNGGYGILSEMARWTRDEKGKLKDEFNHFINNLGWPMVAGVRWRPPQKDRPQVRTPKPVCSQTGW